jgi:hypothetical protein
LENSPGKDFFRNPQTDRRVLKLRHGFRTRLSDGQAPICIYGCIDSETGTNREREIMDRDPVPSIIDPNKYLLAIHNISPPFTPPRIRFNFEQDVFLFKPHWRFAGSTQEQSQRLAGNFFGVLDGGKRADGTQLRNINVQWFAKIQTMALFHDPEISHELSEFDLSMLEKANDLKLVYIFSKASSDSSKESYVTAGGIN